MGYTGGNLQLNGLFDVKNYKTATPWLVPTEPTTTDDAKKTITLTFGDGLAFNSSSAGEGDIKTFYLVLPALGDNNFSTVYKLQMTINATVGGTPKTFTKNFNVSVRRRGITNMRALGVNSWATPTVTTGLAGNGTADRPFKIYTLADMQYLRNHYNGDRKLNGQPITENTHIVLMRSDIVLNETNWTSGIQNFIGVFDDSTHASSTPGIKNISHVPIFMEILAGGHVRHLTVKTENTHISTSSTTGVSPFCNVNRGRIELCVIKGSAYANFADIAGIAGQNLSGGVISACACEASLSSNGNNHRVAGICLNNSGVDASDNPSTIKECYATGSLTVNADEAAGICYGNNSSAVVKDCYFSATISGNAKWGGVVFHNSGTVNHCYTSNATSLTTTSTVGGIVHTLDNGIVNDCWLEGSVKGSSAGGVIYQVIGGKVINSYTNGVLTITSTSGVSAGLVATLSGAGKVHNCYVYDINIIGPTKGGLIGTISGGEVINCYAYETSARNFYNSKTSGTLDRCYVVDPVSDQANVTRVTETNATALSNIPGALVDLLNAPTLPTGAFVWIRPSGLNQVPILSTSLSKSKHPRRR